MTAASWRSIHTNGIRMAVSEQGAGLPVVLCHGFPEIAYSWRHQMPALAAAGFRAIAPDQRGYGETDRPAAVRDYDIHHLTPDLVGLLDPPGLDPAAGPEPGRGGRRTRAAGPPAALRGRAPGLRARLRADRLHGRDQLVPQLGPELGDDAPARRGEGRDPRAHGHRGARPRPAARAGRGDARPRVRSRDGHDPGLRPLDAAGAARRALRHHDRLAHAPVPQRVSTAAAHPAGSSI